MGDLVFQLTTNHRDEVGINRILVGNRTGTQESARRQRTVIFQRTAENKHVRTIEGLVAIFVFYVRAYTPITVVSDRTTNLSMANTEIKVDIRIKLFNKVTLFQELTNDT